MRKIQLTFLIILLVGFADAANAQEENIYMVKMYQCAHRPVERSQTGFRVRGVKGIYTALHGVLDCKTIKAQGSKRGLSLDQPLTIKKVNKDYDVALLSSPQLDGAPDGGFNVAQDIAWDSLRRVTVLGHPLGLENLRSSLRVRNPPLKPLRELVPPNPLSILMDRGSPNHRINVISLQGDVLPGHSGAPILDAQNNVVGIANGGLKGGTVGIAWAMPFNDIDWDTTGLTDKLKALAQLDPEVLFATDILPATASDDVQGDFCGQVSRLVAESRTGFIGVVGAPPEILGVELPTSFFKPKIMVPGAIFGHMRPNYFVSYTMYSADKRGQVESQYYELASKVVACFPTWEREEKPKSGLVYTLADGTDSRRKYLFRENDKSPLIEVSYNLKPRDYGEKYTLSFYVYSVSYRTWY